MRVSFEIKRPRLTIRRMIRIVLWLALLLIAQRTWHQWQDFRKRAGEYAAIEAEHLHDADRLEGSALSAEGAGLVAARRGEKIRLAAEERKREGRFTPDEDDGGSWAAASKRMNESASRFRSYAAQARSEAALAARRKDYYKRRWW